MKTQILQIVIAFTIIVSGCGEPTPSFTDANLGETELTLSRGAFHFDEFIVTSKFLNYKAPKDSHYLKDNPEYLKDQSISMDEKDFKELIKMILDNGFWNFNESYEESSTCTSGISVTLKIGDKFKTVECEDFERGCPELLYQIEKKIIELNNNRLARTVLPG